MSDKTTTIVLHYKGNYGFKTVHKTWRDLYLPGNRLSTWIKDAVDLTSPDDIRFVKTNKMVQKDGSEYVLWEPKSTEDELTKEE